MPLTKNSRQEIDRLRRGRPSVRLPGTETKLSLPDRPSLIWYAGLGVMAAAELIEWPVALIVAGTHLIETQSHNRDVEELADGIQAGS